MLSITHSWRHIGFILKVEILFNKSPERETPITSVSSCCQEKEEVSVILYRCAFQIHLFISPEAENTWKPSLGNYSEIWLWRCRCRFWLPAVKKVFQTLNWGVASVATPCAQWMFLPLKSSEHLKSVKNNFWFCYVTAGALSNHDCFITHASWLAAPLFKFHKHNIPFIYNLKATLTLFTSSSATISE